MNENEIGTIVIGAAIKVHQALGPGLLESVYETVLAYELKKQGLDVKRQVKMQIEYDGIIFEGAYFADIIVNDKVILELKSAKKIDAAHTKQLQTYLSLTGLKLGYVLNFGATYMKDGIKRRVNKLPE